VIKDWNSLPQSIIGSSSVNDFKTLLDRHYTVIIYLILVISVFECTGESLYHKYKYKEFFFNQASKLTKHQIKIL